MHPSDVRHRAAAGVPSAARGARIADFGCGKLGQIRFLAELGAHTVGVDVDPLLPALHSEPGDLGAVGPGSVKLATGQWPATDAMRAAVGGELDLFLSKNTLKNGYVALEFDRDDSPAAREMAHALGWDTGEGGMKLEQDLFATWSLFRRR
jgi:hypothetical protein